MGELPVAELSQFVDDAVREEDVGGPATFGNLGADAYAGLGLAGAGVDVAHVQAHDFGQAEASAEGEAEREVVAGVRGGYGEQGGLLGAGKGLGAQRGHGDNGAIF